MVEKRGKPGEGVKGRIIRTSEATRAIIQGKYGGMGAGEEMGGNEGDRGRKLYTVICVQ